MIITKDTERCYYNVIHANGITTIKEDECYEKQKAKDKEILEDKTFHKSEGI